MSIEPYNTVGGMGYIYDQEKDDFEMIRVVEITDDEIFMVKDVDGKTYHIKEDSEPRQLSKDELSKYTFLEPDAVLTLTNVNMFTDDKGKVVRDVMIMMFTPNSDGTFEFLEPKLLARQLLDNPYDENAQGKCGFSYSKEDLEAVDGLMSDLLYSESIINSKKACMYKTDNLDDVVTILDNETKDDDKGICPNLKEFMKKFGVLYDARLNLGISYIDMEFGDRTTLEEDARMVLSLLYSIKVIDRSLVAKFSYEVELDSIKMPYFLVYDANDILYIVAYTKCKEELLKSELKKVEDHTEEIYQHIRNITKSMVNSEE